MGTKLILQVAILCVASMAASATSVDFTPLRFKIGYPTSSSSFSESVEDKSLASEAVNRNIQLIRALSHAKFLITGFTDGQECSPNLCKALALRRAEMLHKALLEHGISGDIFCPLEAKTTPWPNSYTPKPEDMDLAHQSEIIPVFAGCA